MVCQAGNQEFVAEAFGVTLAPQKCQYASHLRFRVNHKLTGRSQARHHRAVKFGPVGIYRRIDGTQHLDTKERSFWQTVQAITAGGIKPGMEIKGHDGSGSDMYGDYVGGLALRDARERSGKKQSNQGYTFHRLGPFVSLDIQKVA